MKVMLIDEDYERAAVLSAALHRSGCDVQLMDSLDCNGYLHYDNATDVILINMDVPERDIFDCLARLNQEKPKPVVMFANDDNQKTIQAAIKAGVSAYVVDGFNPNRVKTVLDIAVARFNEYQIMREELINTKTQLADRKLIEKAKGLLMAHKAMSEDQAYQALRKLAMDKNQKISEIAEQLIEMADILI